MSVEQKEHGVYCGEGFYSAEEPAETNARQSVTGAETSEGIKESREEGIKEGGGSFGLT